MPTPNDETFNFTSSPAVEPTDTVNTAETTEYPPPTVVSIWGPQEQRPPRPVGMGDVILGFVYSQVLGLIPALIAVVFVLWKSADTLLTATPTGTEKLINDATQAGPVILASLILSWIGFLIAVWWAGTHKGDKNWRELLHWHFRPLHDIPIAIAFVIFFRLFEYGLGWTLERIGVDTSKLGNGNLVGDQTGIWLILVAIGASIGAPFVEEIFFRGMFLTVARRNWGTAIGVIVTSVVFGIMHAQPTLASSIYTIAFTTLIGATLAILVVKTNRLGTSISSHVLFNTSAVLLMMLTQ